MSYKAKHPLFRDLTEHEVLQFRAYTRKLCKEGFEISALEGVHPIIRKHLIELIKESLATQGEL